MSASEAGYPGSISDPCFLRQPVRTGIPIDRHGMDPRLKAGMKKALAPIAVGAVMEGRGGAAADLPPCGGDGW